MGLNNKHTLQSGTIVLVTGAAGFIGFHVSQALLERGCVVIGYNYRYQLQRPQIPQESQNGASRANVIKLTK